MAKVSHTAKRPHQWAGREVSSPSVGLLRTGGDEVLSHFGLICLSHSQYIDAIGNKQGELESYVSDGYKTALTEERRRFCFLVEKQCAVAKNSAAYHSKVGTCSSRGWALTGTNCLPGEYGGVPHLEL